MVQSAEEWSGYDVARCLGRPVDRCVFGNSEMRMHGIVVIRVRGKGTPQMRDTKDDDMVKTFPSDRADHPVCTDYSILVYR